MFLTRPWKVGVDRAPYCPHSVSLLNTGIGNETCELNNMLSPDGLIDQGIGSETCELNNMLSPDGPIEYRNR